MQRGGQLFRQTVPKEDRNYGGKEADKVFSPPRGYKRAIESVRCSSAECRGLVQPSHQFCPTCGAKNEAFSSVSQAVEMGARQQGYRRKATALTNMEDALDYEPAAKKHLCKVWGDMLSKVAGKDPAAPCTPAPVSAAVPPAPAVPQEPPKASSTSAQAPCLPAPPPESSEKEKKTEYDLDVAEDACQFILAHFKASLQEEARPAVEFFVGELKKKASKIKPLSAWMQKEIVATRVLMKPQSRHMWLTSWKENRSHRYVSGPK